MGDLVLLEADGDIGVLTLNRPEAGNAMDHALLTELAAATSQLHGYKGVLVTGAGKDFCRGGDLREMDRRLGDPSVDSRAYSHELTDLLGAAIRDIRALPCPVLAAVNGQAAGAGMSLALACDLRLASRRAAFHIAYGALGASTDGGMSWFLPRLVGHGRALELLLEQPVLRASRAAELGLVTEVVEPSELRAEALYRLRALSSAAPHTLRSAKRLLDTALHTSLEDHLAAEHELFADGAASADLRTGIGALLAGETPEFHGR
ncbi:enoyl-CoA hydratase/isomerase family protein [Streptomyces sp. NPDC018610]|jgi:enoyl-CoA hydratase/carnithine racemase|uniref:enoyl-CoA hydratase/isomerase family protein n=1 Tax=Streptomyces sp. NPDC018610 TaxID=3365049 RepID=UPI0037BDB316